MVPPIRSTFAAFPARQRRECETARSALTASVARVRPESAAAIIRVPPGANRRRLAFWASSTRAGLRPSLRLHPHPALRAALSPVVSLYGERQAFAFGRGQEAEFAGDPAFWPSPLVGEGSRRKAGG